MSLKDKVLFITGGSRGIGLATALRAAKDGANIVIASKTVTPHPKLPGTIYTAQEAIIEAGGQCLAIPTDIRDEQQIIKAIDETVNHFGGLDILFNNASAIFPSTVRHTEAKRYDLMFDINGRGSLLCAKYAIPHLLKSKNPHILNNSPPISFDRAPRGMFSLNEHVLKGKTAYMVSKYLMTFWTLGMAEELRSQGIAVNSIWPVTPIDTAAVRNVLPQALSIARSPEIVADACYQIFVQPSREYTGQCLLDEDVLISSGKIDFTQYSLNQDNQ
ncbi:MAG: NAD(P)-dependent oxidoreductase [Pseudomonadota bacterium]|nr:NAD(P)-dependent oxidoreductase [Pseudomonadota bacterium]